MKKVLFLIHDLGRGGAEKVLVNLVNHLDPEQFDVTVTSLFGGGVMESRLNPNIRFRAVFPRMLPGNSHWMKLMSPAALHRLCVQEHYDVEVSYLEGPSARVISGCSDPDTKLVCWIHCVFDSIKHAAAPFRTVREAEECYRSFHRIICVSETSRCAFERLFVLDRPVSVLYNTVDSEQIVKLSQTASANSSGDAQERRLIGVGTMKAVKAFDRLLRILARLRGEGIPSRLLLVGDGPDREALKGLARELRLESAVDFVGYQQNPYPYLARCDLFVCSSLSEGFSTAATEALILGVPVCTTEVSGMREMLGDNEYGLITDNDEEALYQGVKRMLTEPGLLEHYRAKARERGQYFSVENTVKAVEDMLNA